jgi:hypothetical protein
MSDPLIIILVVIMVGVALYYAGVFETEDKKPTTTTPTPPTPPTTPTPPGEDTDSETESESDDDGPLKDVPLNKAVRCLSNNADGKGEGAVYRHVGSNQLRHYPNPEVAGSWDTTWGTQTEIADCTGVTFGDIMEMKPLSAAETVIADGRTPAATTTTASTPAASTPASTTPAAPTPIDCKGDWVLTSCDHTWSASGRGNNKSRRFTKKYSYNITQLPQHGGAACPDPPTKSEDVYRTGKVSDVKAIVCP